MSENGEIYTAGKNFTLLPALTGWTNSTSDDGGFDDDGGDLLRGSVYRQQVIWQILPLDGAVDSHLPRYWRIKIQNTTLSDILDLRM